MSYVVLPQNITYLLYLFKKVISDFLERQKYTKMPCKYSTMLIIMQNNTRLHGLVKKSVRSDQILREGEYCKQTTQVDSVKIQLVHSQLTFVLSEEFHCFDWFSLLII